jgi:hypothetical protein
MLLEKWPWRFAFIFASGRRGFSESNSEVCWKKNVLSTD